VCTPQTALFARELIINDEALRARMGGKQRIRMDDKPFDVESGLDQIRTDSANEAALMIKEANIAAKKRFASEVKTPLQK